jgi:predicted metal-dependent phosphoesterase TrpH
MNKQRTIRVDFHSHTRHSVDAWTSPREWVEHAAAAGLDRVAVTDHDEIEGALEAQAVAPDRVIVGEEVTCRCGTHLIGLFLRERIPPRLALEEVAERIRDQGGVVYAPHPYAYVRRAAWRAERALAVADVVEGYNSRAFVPAWNVRAAAEARRRGVPLLAGTDAHFAWELGRAYAELPAFRGAQDFLDAARRARPVLVRAGSPFLHLASTGLKWARRLRGWTPHDTRHATRDNGPTGPPVPFRNSRGAKLREERGPAAGKA